MDQNLDTTYTEEQKSDSLHCQLKQYALKVMAGPLKRGQRDRLTRARIFRRTRTDLGSGDS